MSPTGGQFKIAKPHQALLGWKQASDGLQQRGLAGAIGAEDADGATLLHGEGDVSENRQRAIAAAKVIYGQEGGHKSAPK